MSGMVVAISNLISHTPSNVNVVVMDARCGFFLTAAVDAFGFQNAVRCSEVLAILRFLYI